MDENAIRAVIREALWRNQRHVVQTATALGRIGSHVSLAEAEFGELAVAVLTALQRAGYRIERDAPAGEGVMLYRPCALCAERMEARFGCPDCGGTGYVPLDPAALHLRITEAIEGARMWALVAGIATDDTDMRVEESAAMADAVLAALTGEDATSPDRG